MNETKNYNHRILGILLIIESDEGDSNFYFICF